jgi:hypothetical protein
MSFNLPFGVKTLNPIYSDFWKGPYTGSDAVTAKAVAIDVIPSAIRVIGMEVTLVYAGASHLYWFKNGIDDADLVPFETTVLSETDPTVPSHVKAITTTNINNWNTSFGWGDHSLVGYLLASTAAATYIPLSQKGASLGVVPLNVSSKIDTVYLPDSVLGNVQWQGNWDGSTDTPTLPTPSATNKGHYYIVQVAGIYGGKDYGIGDWIISDGIIWDKVDNTDALISFNGRIGVITLNSLDVTTALGYTPINPNGTVSQYIRGDGSFATFPTLVSQFTNDALYLNQVQTDALYSPLGHTHTFASLTSKPTTIAGYGITDAYVKTEINDFFGGVTAITGYNKSQWDIAYGWGDPSLTYVPLSRTINGINLEANQTFSTGTTGTDFNIVSTGTNHQFNIPNASATNRGMMSTGTQTFAGIKTFSGRINSTVASGQMAFRNATGAVISMVDPTLSYESILDYGGLYVTDDVTTVNGAFSSTGVYIYNDTGVITLLSLDGLTKYISVDQFGVFSHLSIEGNSIKKTGGLATEFLKADGSVTNDSFSNYLPLAGGTMSGQIHMGDNLIRNATLNLSTIGDAVAYNTTEPGIAGSYQFLVIDGGNSTGRGLTGTRLLSDFNLVTGNATANQVAVWSGTNSQIGDADFTYNPTTNALGLNGTLTANYIVLNSAHSSQAIRFTADSAWIGTGTTYGVTNNTYGILFRKSGTNGFDTLDLYSRHGITFSNGNTNSSVGVFNSLGNLILGNNAPTDDTYSTNRLTVLGTMEATTPAGSSVGGILTTSAAGSGQFQYRTPAQLVGDIGAVPTTRTITINGTTLDLSADRSFTINSMVYPGAGIPVSTGSAWGASITNNSSNWNTAFGWGNHAGLYPTYTGSGATGTWGINVTGTAGSETLATVTSRGASTSTESIFTGNLRARKSQTTGDYTTAALWTESFSSTATGIAFHISGNQGKFLEMRTNGILYWNNDQVVTNGGTWNFNISGNAASATNVAWTGVTGRPTNLSQFTNDLGNYGGWITGINASMVNAVGTITNNTSGNAATATNSSQWGGYTNNIGGGPYSGAPDTVGGFSSTTLQRYSAGAIQSFLGLGSMAYASTSSYLPIGGNAVSASYAPSIGINYNNNSDSQYQILWGSGNYAYGTAGVVLNALTDTIYASGGITDTAYSRIVTPRGGAYQTTASVVNGAIKIRQPFYQGAQMSKMTVKIYEYLTGYSFTITICGHRDSANWYNVSAYQNGDSGAGDITVRFGHDGSYNCIWIGETGRAWSYPQVFITDVQNGYSSINTLWNQDWSISFVSSFDTVQTSRVAYATSKNGHTHDYATHRGEGTNYVDYSRYVYNNGAYSGSGWVEPSDLGVRYANNAGLLGGNTWSATSGAYTIVQRDGNGYIQNSYFYTSSGGAERNGSGLGYFAGFNSSDYYIRSYTIGAAQAALGLGSMAYQSTGNYYTAGTSDGRYAYVGGGNASGTWGINISGNSATSTNATNATYLWATSHVGTYYVSNAWTGTYWRFTSNHGAGVSVQHSTVSDSSSQVTINYGNDSASNYYMLWGSGNSVYATGGIFCNPSIDTIYAVSYRGSGNVSGTGEASHHPAGIFSQGTNWLYGTIYMSGNTIESCYRVSVTGDLRFDHSSWTGEANKLQWHSGNVYIQNTSTGNLVYRDASGINVFNVTIAGNIQTKGSIYPSDQSSYYLYMANSGLWTNGNLGAGGDLYLGTRGVWLSSWLNQSVQTGANVTFNTVTGSNGGFNSDINDKTDFDRTGVNSILNLRGLSYLRISTDKREYGYIAQEVQQYLPEAVYQTDKGLAVSYHAVNAARIDAVQSETDILKEKVAKLEEQVRQLGGNV